MNTSILKSSAPAISSSSARHRSFWFGLIAAFSSSAAFAADVNIEFDESVDFTKFKTFAIRDGRITSRSPALNSELTKKRIQAEIERAFIKKGLVVAEQPDLDITFDFGSARAMDTKTYPVGWRGRGTRVVNVRVSEGTLTIDLNDRATKALVWRGISSDEEPNPMKLADKLDDLVKKSVSKYPPKQKK